MTRRGAAFGVVAACVGLAGGAAADKCPKRPPCGADEVLDAATACCLPKPAAATSRRVTIDSVPPGALLVDNGRELGRTPWTGVLAAGDNHRIEVRLDAYEPVLLYVDPARDAHGQTIHLDTPLAAATDVAGPGSVYFARGKDAVSPAARPLVEEMGKIIAINPDRLVTLAGNADNEEPNQAQVSYARASAVAALLIDSGVPAARIRAVGRGIGHPVAPNDTEENRAKNRRVDLVFHAAGTTTTGWPAPPFRFVVATGDRIEVKATIEFAEGKATLLPKGLAILDEMTRLLAARPTVRLEVGAHTDSRGDDHHNLELSQARAAAVKAYLVGRGVDSARLEAKGYGEYQPIADNRTPSGRTLNGRVEFRILAQ